MKFNPSIYLTIALTAVAFGLIVFVLNSAKIGRSVEKERTNDSLYNALRAKNDSLTRKNWILISEHKSILVKMDSLKNVIKNIEANGRVLTTRKNKEINRISNVHADSLFMFFSNLKAGYSPTGE